ncbi:MAG: CBS domain-containing protein [Methanomicrobiales archaeon]
MSPSVISITADMTLEDALRMMITHDIDHLPVVIDDEERRSLVGFLTRTDIMQAYVRWMSRLR